MKSDFVDRVERKIWPVRVQNKQASQHYYEMLAYHKRLDGNIPDNAVIFIGDSLTQSLAVAAISPLSVNYGIGNDTSIGVLRRIDEYRSIKRSRIIVVAIGINDLKIGRTKEEILYYFEEIIKKINYKKMVIFNSIHPVDEKLQGKKNRTNKMISSINDGLEKICSKYPNVYFLNTYKALTDNTGNLQRLYHVGDNVINLSSCLIAIIEALSISI